MFTVILSLAAAAVLLSLASFLTLRRKGPGDTSLGCTVLLLAGIEAVEGLSLWAPAGSPAVLRRLIMVLEAMLPAALLWYGFSFARHEPVRMRSLRGALLVATLALFPAAVLFLPVEILFSAQDFQTEHVLFLGNGGYWIYLGVTLSFVTALVNIEGTFLSTSGSDRWKIKYEAIGAGSMIIVLIFYISQGLLYRAINAELVPVRSSILIIAGGLVFAAKLFRDTGVRVSVSRSVLYRSAVLVAAGVYFIVLGLLAEGVNYLKAPFGKYLMALAGFAAGIALLAAFLSERIRRLARVIVSKHFFATKHDYRSTWLDLTNRFAACGSRAELEEAIPAAYREIFGLRSAALYLLDARSGRYVPAGGAEAGQAAFALSPRLLSYFRDRNRVWNVADGEYAPLQEEAAFARSSRARLVVPLICNTRVEGLVAFGPSITGEPFSFEDYDFMKIIARHSALVLSNLRLSEELIETGELAAMARVSSFVIHDLKNLAHTLSLLMDNAQDHIANQEFQHDMIATIRHTAGTMKELIQKLKVMPGNGTPRRQAHDLRLLAREVLQHMAAARPGAALTCSGEPVSCMIDGDELRTVIVNLVQNGLESAGEEAMITVETGMQDGHAFLRVSDNGCGMTKEFMQHQLFRPFRSTKKTGLGIGLYQCRQIVESFGGTIEASSGHGAGSSFTVRIPAAADRGRMPTPDAKARLISA
jgi:putative PEP-CTERM system histidine kinase